MTAPENENQSPDPFVKDSDQDLFDTWIHPVLDLCHVPIDSLSNPNWEALHEYLLGALAERDAAQRHLVADHLRRNPGGETYREAVADEIHPDHGPNEADCTDFGFPSE